MEETTPEIVIEEVTTDVQELVTIGDTVIQTPNVEVVQKPDGATSTTYY